MPFYKNIVVSVDLAVACCIARQKLSVVEGERVHTVTLNKNIVVFFDIAASVNVAAYDDRQVDAVAVCENIARADRSVR